LPYVPYKAYEGPELADAALAVVKTYPAYPKDLAPYQSVYKITWLDKTYYSADDRGGDATAIHLRPDRYLIALEGRCTAKWYPSRRTFGATLRPGHTYLVKSHCGFLYGSISLWLEDTVTGEDVTRSKAIRIPLESSRPLADPGIY
jgi:hypothetical protein